MAPRKFTDKKLLIGSQNPGKIKEFEKLLSPLGIHVMSLKDITIKDPEETGVTFLDNALLKAHYYAKSLNIPTLADDSGLCIEALDQKPGVYTKRFMEELGGEDLYFSKLSALLEGHNKTASMHCVLALAWPDGHAESFEGICDGTLTFPARHGAGNSKGFGVDPIFLPKNHFQTFSEDIDHKNKVSHRTKALELLFKTCFSEALSC